MKPRVSPLPGLIAQLHEHRATLRAAVERVPVTLHRERPSPDSWSVAEVVEHVSIVETRIVKLLKHLVSTAPVLPAGTDPTGPLSADGTIMSDRSTRIPAPPMTHPSAGLEADASLAALEMSRAELLAALEGAHDRDLGAVSAPHPLFGPLNGFQWLSFHGGHEARHAAQIVETAGIVAGKDRMVDRV